VVDGIDIVDLEGDILHSIAVTLLVFMHLLELPRLCLGEAVFLLKASKW
jgi:hypothetical protein